MSSSVIYIVILFSPPNHIQNKDGCLLGCCAEAVLAASIIRA
jgi:hypothetical protein